MQPSEHQPPVLLRLPEVKRRTGLSRSTVYKWMKDGQFPARKHVGQRSVAWLEQDINRWIEGATHD
ncbi:MAG: helix-turn-helix transcriptional regulator [Acidiferrobacter sp.]